MNKKIEQRIAKIEFTEQLESLKNKLDKMHRLIEVLSDYTKYNQNYDKVENMVFTLTYLNKITEQTAYELFRLKET